MNDSPADWKAQLLAQCADVVENLPDEAPGILRPDSETRPPSLYAFFEELLATRNELRKGNRKTAETFSRFGDVLEAMQADSHQLRGRLAEASETPSGEDAGHRHNLAMALVGLRDRIQRLLAATQEHSGKGWPGFFRQEQRWRQQTDAIGILGDQLRTLMESEGIQLVEPVPGSPFDPLRMQAVGEVEGAQDEPGNLAVAETLQSGYQLDGKCLRQAEVRLRHSPASGAD